MNAVLEMPCPSCGALPGELCQSKSGRTYTPKTCHPARGRLLAKANGQDAWTAKHPNTPPSAR